VGDKAKVKDAAEEVYEVAGDHIWRDTSVMGLSRRAQLIPGHHYSVTFQWICAVDATDKEVVFWQDENKEATLKTIKLEPFTKEMPDTKRTVHRGYQAHVDIMANTTYCYNFKIGASHFFEWDKPAKSADSHRKFKLVIAIV